MSAVSSANAAPLLALAVHEFRTPVSVVGGYLRMLRLDDDPPHSPRQQKMIEEAERSCARIGALIAELSEIAQIDAGTAVVNEQDFDLFRALSDAARGIHEAGDRGVRLQLGGKAAGARMTGDLTRLENAFAALFRAVLREQPASCTVVAERRLNTTGQTSVATIVIAEEASLQRAHDAPAAPFDEHRGGLGLLLPMARRVIERHGGRLWSPSPSGSTPAIIVSLPLVLSPRGARP